MPLTHSDDLIRATARDSFWNAYDGPPSVFEGLVATYDSNSDQETYAALGSPPSVREMMGSKMRKALAPLKYTVVNKKYEGSFIVDYPTRKFGFSFLSGIAHTLGRATLLVGEQKDVMDKLFPNIAKLRVFPYRDPAGRDLATSLEEFLS